MSIIKSRIVAAIRGAFIADAASLGTHWIYDPLEMAKEVPSVDAPEFKNPPTPRFYSSDEFPGHYKHGMASPYGEQLLFVTEYVAQNRNVDGTSMSEAMLKWAETFGGRPDHALQTFMENMSKDDGKWPNCGADDNQAHCFMKVIPVTCLYAGKAELKEKVTDAIKIHQNNQEAVNYGLASSRILEKVILGMSLKDALDEFEKELVTEENQNQQSTLIKETFLEAKRASSEMSLGDFLKKKSNEMMKDKPDSPFYDLAARSCALPGSFMAPIFLLFASLRSESDAYATAIRQNILAAGDTASRAQIVGAILAAANHEPPQSWVENMDPEFLAKIDAAAATIADSA